MGTYPNFLQRQGFGYDFTFFRKEIKILLMEIIDFETEVQM